MTIKWKKTKNFKPEVILEKINSSKTVTKDGQVYFSLEYQEYLVSLYSMIDFPRPIDDALDSDLLLSKALNTILKNSEVTKDKLIEQLNAIVKQELSTREKTFFMLTSISVFGDFPFKKFSFDGCIMRVVKEYPKKYLSREKLISGSSPTIKSSHKGYTKIVISVKAKSVHGAAKKCLGCIDFVRSVLCFFTNPGMDILGYSRKPINRITMGEAHTLHDEKGRPALKSFWYEPNFVEATPFRLSDIKKIRRVMDKFFSDLNGCKYSSVIEDSMLRFVRSLDESNLDTAFVGLWGALESLASPGESNYDAVVRRCSFLFEEAKYHVQVLEHLREYRNRNVHVGYRNDNARTFCFQLQFYYRKLVVFHLKSGSDFCDLSHANNFLDMPVDADKIFEKKDMIDKVVRFRGLGS